MGRPPPSTEPSGLHGPVQGPGDAKVADTLPQFREGKPLAKWNHKKPAGPVGFDANLQLPLSSNGSGRSKGCGDLENRDLRPVGSPHPPPYQNGHSWKSWRAFQSEGIGLDLPATLARGWVTFGPSLIAPDLYWGCGLRYGKGGEW